MSNGFCIIIARVYFGGNEQDNFQKSVTILNCMLSIITAAISDDCLNTIVKTITSLAKTHLLIF